MPKIRKVTTSYGVIICRQNPQTKCFEAALVLRRYTYAFVDFVLGKYRSRDHKMIIQLLGGMTTQELLDVRSLDFGIMWHRIWNSTKGDEFFMRKQAIFTRNFLGDAGRLLHSLIAQVRSTGELQWEVPKGKKKAASEGDLNCAIRECEEETHIRKTDYVIIPGARRRSEITVSSCQYKQEYFIAIAKPRAPKELGVTFGNRSQIEEVANVRWMGLQELRAIRADHLVDLLRPAFRLAKNRSRD